MRIRYNPALDLCCAMLEYSHWDQIRNANFPGYKISPDLVEWYRDTKSLIPGLLHNDINYLIGNFIGLTFLPVELAVKEDICSADELIAAFDDLESENLPEQLYNSYLTDLKWSEVRGDDEKIRKAIDKAGATTRKKEAQLFLDFSRNPQAFQLRLAGMMRDFYRLAVKPREKESVKLMEAQAAEDQKLLDTDPTGFFANVFRINRKKDETEPQVFLSRYDEFDIIQLDDPQAIIYGRRRSNLDKVGELPLEQIYNLLADDSRRAILKLLCRKSWFIREIADELELTSATVSYHMSRLSGLNLVNYKRGERKRVYYSADRENVERMMQSVADDILG